MLVDVPCRISYLRGINKTITFPSNIIRHVRDIKKRVWPRIIVSGVYFDRGMKTLFVGPDDIRTIIFPSMLKTILQSAFCDVKSLRKAVINEGLEMLGED